MRKEIEYVERLLTPYPRHKSQVNQPFLSDAEIVHFKDGIFAVSIDAICEEYSLGLLQSAETFGWLTVTANVSDLAAVGLKTDSLSIFLSSPADQGEWQKKFDQGVVAACLEYGIEKIERCYTHGSQWLSAGTAYGSSKLKKYMKRTGLQNGDVLFLSGPIGWGNAVALANLKLRSQSASLDSKQTTVKLSALADKYDQGYRPLARWKEALFIKDYADVCIDTSDGLLSTLKWLEIFNHKQLHFNYGKNIFHSVALEVAQITQVNPWLFMAAQNGEFELLFSVSREKYQDFVSKSHQAGYLFLELGTVTDGEGLYLHLPNQRMIHLEVDNLLNMLQDGINPAQYILAMLEFSLKNRITFTGE